jgi:copper homeostasis protein
MTEMLLEICAGSLHSALAAQAGGAHRIELCDNLDQGGTTPSPGIITQAVRLLEIPVFVLIRPRPGDFLYSEEEFQAMKDDIFFCKKHGAKGVVLGILKDDGTVDTKRTGELIQLARPMQVTFHRAFDFTRDPFSALEDIISLGVDRILTSGQAATAMEGAPLINELVMRAENRIRIIPGSGVNEENVAELVRKTGVREVHASLRSRVTSSMDFQGSGASMGLPGSDESSWLETDKERVRQFLEILQNI